MRVEFHVRAEDKGTELYRAVEMDRPPSMGDYVRFFAPEAVVFRVRSVEYVFRESGSGVTTVWCVLERLAPKEAQ